MDNKKDVYLNGIKIDPTRIEFLYGGIYLDGIRLSQKEDWNPPELINCRCSIITKPEEIYFTYATKYLVDEYLEEYKKGLWIN